MSIEPEEQLQLELLNASENNNPPSDPGQGLWTRCEECGLIHFIKHLKENQNICSGCGSNFYMTSQERIDQLIDLGSWRLLDETLSPCDPLEFQDQKNYTERLIEAQERTGLQDAIQTGTGMLNTIPVALGVMDFDFMGGSMGSVVGEKITRLIEYATQEGLILLLVCASGGARMQEGILSLMQMAKIAAALQVYQSSANLLYISILTSPTTGGVTASFAMLGDIIMAEPKALIGFAGRRVIEQTLQEELPKDFQTAEYLLQHGLLDLVVERYFFKEALSEIIFFHQHVPFKRTGFIPHGIQKNLSFVSEEKARRKWNNIADQKQIGSEYTIETFFEKTGKEGEKQETLYSAFKESLSDFSYREICLSFQTIFDLFSVDPVMSFKSSKKKQAATTLELNMPDIAGPYPDPLLLTPNTALGVKEAVSGTEIPLYDKESGESGVKGDSLNQEIQEIPSSFLEYNKTKIDLEESISIAKTDIIEWRAFYVTQKVEPKMFFLKDFSPCFVLDNLEKNQIDLQKKFFYCTSTNIDYNLSLMSISEESEESE